MSREPTFQVGEEAIAAVGIFCGRRSLLRETPPGKINKVVPVCTGTTKKGGETKRASTLSKNKKIPRRLGEGFL